MRNVVFLFVFIFSLFLPAINTTGNHGSTKTDKLLEPKVTKPAPKTLEENVIEAFSNWQTAKASYYDSQDSNQTKSDCDGIGAFGRIIESGSIAFGSMITKTFKDRGLEVFIEVKDLHVVTPYGKGIFRIDDVMASRHNKENSYYIDFFQDDLNSKQKRLGRFKVKFRIIKIVKT